MSFKIVLDYVARLRLNLCWTLRRRRKGIASANAIISLTSYPPRFKQLDLTLKSLLLQTENLPVVLWVAHADMGEIPQSVLDLQKYGLVIRSCADLRSYKKIFPASWLYPEATIITADDDVYYWRTWAKELLAADDGNTVVCHRAHRITLSSSGAIRPYREWEWNITASAADKLTFPTGMGGVLYPPRAFKATNPNDTLFLDICPSGDDIWLFWMWRREGLHARKVKGQERIHLWNGSQDGALWHINVDALANDVQIQRMLDHFGLPF